MIKGGTGNDTIRIGQGGVGLVGAIGTIDGGAGTDSIILDDVDHLAAFEKTYTAFAGIVASVQYSSGDVIAVTTGVAALGGGFTKVNVGSALPSIAILTTLTAVSTSALAESLYGNTVVGNISVYDTDGNAGTDGDLIIGISGGANRTKAVGIRIIGGDELITTTKIGKQSASLVNITVAQQGTLGYNIPVG